MLGPSPSEGGLAGEDGLEQSVYSYSGLNTSPAQVWGPRWIHSQLIEKRCDDIWAVESKLDQEALESAELKYVKAERAIAAYEAADNYVSAELAWTDFLLASATIYSKLEQGSKIASRSRAWYQAKKAERHSDPLLNYLHAARNAEEHGVKRIVKKRGASRAVMGPPLRFGERRDFTGEYRDPQGNVVIKDLVLAEAGPGLEAIRVRGSQRGTFCDPPTRHLGAPIHFGGLFPLELGKLGLRYLRSMLDEARQLSG